MNPISFYLKLTQRHLVTTFSRQLAVIACGFAVLIMFSNVPYFYDALTGTIQAPLFFAAQILMALLLAAMNPTRIAGFLKSDVFRLICAILFLYLWNWAWLQFDSRGASSEELDNTGRRLRQLINFPSAAFIVYIAGRVVFLRWLMVAVITVPVPVIVHFLAPDIHEVFDTLRASGFYLNPNQACEGMLLWMVMMQQRLRGKVLLALYVVMAFAILLTFSRSGLVGLILVGGFLFYKKRIPRVSIAIPVLVLVFYSSILVGVEIILEDFVENESQLTALMERFNFIGSLGSDDSGVDDSTVERKQIVREAFDEVLSQPLLGVGREPHFSLGLSSHNAFIELWYVYGAFGLALYFYIAWLLYKAGLKQGYGLFNPYLILYLWFTPFNHAHITGIYWMVFYSFVLMGKETKSTAQEPLWLSRLGTTASANRIGSSRRRRRRRRRSTGI